VLPNKRNVTPRYDQITLKLEDRHNKLQQILSPNADDQGVWIHQNAWFHLGKFDKGISTDYTIKGKENGVYIFNLTGTLEVNGQLVETRDGFGIWDTDKINIKANTDSEFLIMEVPMTA
jgi:redox-sensitive bicupin YhaK (pirin superfamily)